MSKSNAREAGRRRSTLTAYISLAMVIALIGVLVMFQTMNPQKKLDSYKEKESELDEMINVEQARTDELHLFEKEVQTDAYVEEQAHEKLKLLKENQLMFVAE